MVENMKNVNKIKSGQVLCVLRALRGLVVYRDRLPNDYISWKGTVETFVGAKKKRRLSEDMPNF